MNRQRIEYLFLNVGHLYDHMFMLLFATVAALALADEWAVEYSDLILWATPGFVAFGALALPAGWLADKWSRSGMMLLFFLGIGTSSLLAGLARTPLELGAALLLMGCFAAIYHPVGIAMVVQVREDTGVALAVNGVMAWCFATVAPPVCPLTARADVHARRPGNCRAVHCCASSRSSSSPPPAAA